MACDRQTVAVQLKFELKIWSNIRHENNIAEHQIRSLTVDRVGKSCVVHLGSTRDNSKDGKLPPVTDIVDNRFRTPAERDAYV